MATPFDDLPNEKPADADHFGDLPDAPKTRLGRALLYADNLVRQAANGVTFGLADELAAGADTALSPLTGSDKTYDQRLTNERNRDKAFRDENPTAATVAEIAGALAAPGAGIAKLASKVPTLLGRGAVTGATMGGLSGFANGEGGFESRLNSAGRGALAGGGIGIALPGGVALARRGLPMLGDAVEGVGTVGRTLTGAYNPENRALDRIATKVEESGKDPADILTAVDSSGGKPVSLLDVGGEQVQRLGRTVSDMPGPGSTRIKDFLTERDLGVGENPLARTGGASDRIAGDLEKTFGDKLFHATDDALVDAQKTAADPLYAAFEKNDPVPAGTFADFLARPAIQDALKKAQRLAKNEGVDDLSRSFRVEPVTGSYTLTGVAIPPRTVDNIKKGLDDVIGAAKRTGENNDVRIITKLKNDFLKVADDNLPGYSDARNAWAGPAGAREALQFGRDAIRMDGEDVVRRFAGLSEGEQDMARVGLKKALFDKVKSTPDGADELKRVVGTPAMRERLAAMLKPAEYDDLIGQLGTEAKMYGTKSQILGGSRTAPSMADMAENVMSDAMASVAQKGPVGAAVDMAIKKIASAGTMTKRTADASAKFLTETDPAEIAKIVDQLQGRIKVQPSTTSKLMKYGLNRQDALTAALSMQQSDGH